MYSLMQMAVSVLVDLGLDQSPEHVLEERHDLHLHNPTLRSNMPSLKLDFGIEARRAALGCFHLSAL